MRTLQAILALIVIVLVFQGAALAGGGNPATQFEFSRATNTGDVIVHFEKDGVVDDITVPIPAGAPASAKRDLIQDVVGSKGYGASPVGEAGLRFTQSGKKFDSVTVDTGATGEARDAGAARGLERGNVRFNPDVYFEPYASDGTEATFRAGFITDLGGVELELASGELEYLTDGFHIMAVLYELLAPVAPDYGVDLVLDDLGLSFYFDPTVTRQGGGIVFGTTSPTSGLSGEVIVPGGLGDLGSAPALTLVSTDKIEGVTRTKFKSGNVTGDTFCVYVVSAVTGGSAFRVGDEICINCPGGGDCPPRTPFLYTADNGDETWGWWSRNSLDGSCEDCSADGLKGYVFE